MPKITLKVKTKSRTIDDAKDGLVYKMTLVKKEGKKGEPTYKKTQLTVEEGTPELYHAYEPDETILVSIDPAHQKLDTFTRDQEESPE